MAKKIKTVKEKKQLQKLLSTISQGKDLLQDWINLEPIYVGEKTSADYTSSIQKHLLDSVKEVKVDDMTCEPPVVPDHIQLHKGWFKDTVPQWQRNNKGPIAFLHMDADIYSSTKEVLTMLNQQIVPGTVITFDEICNFRLSGKMSKWQDQEFLALIEWLDENKREVKVLNRNWAYQASCVVVS